MNNIILMSDSYKVSHYKQYPPNTQKVYSYFESRGGEFDKTVFFGLQYFLKRYLQGVVISKEKIEEAAVIFSQHFGDDKLFNKEGWYRLLEKHNGKLPVKIKAVPEGTLVNTHNVLMTIENTDEEFYWLTNYLETLLVQVWYPTTVATLSYHCKQMMKDYAEVTGTDISSLDFKLHDFGFRGVSSVESAMIGGLAHLLNFKGTDTVASLVCAKDYYNSTQCPAFSIPAAEHSTITSWGKDKEKEAYENMLEQYPTGLVACVSDSYDIYKACENIWGKQLREKVLQRDGCLVIRPDSGDPEEVVVKVLQILDNKFGSTINEKGYKVLNNKVRVIQGDGVNFESIESILQNMVVNGFAVDNIAFGMGGALLQKLNRDTQKFAFKCSAIKKHDEWCEVYKKPVTDKGKDSKKGLLKLIKVENKYYTVQIDNKDTKWSEDKLVTVFEDGEIKKEYAFEECRSNLNA